MVQEMVWDTGTYTLAEENDDDFEKIYKRRFTKRSSKFYP